MDEKEKQAIETAARNRGRAMAQSRAYQRLSKDYYEKYEQYYREECAKLGLQNRQTRAERIALLRRELERLEQDLGVGGSK